jgi:hypothetical protein
MEVWDPQTTLWLRALLAATAEDLASEAVMEETAPSGASCGAWALRLRVAEMGRPTL